MRIDVVTRPFEKTGVITEPWFESPYVVGDIQPSVLQLWNNPGVTDVSLHLPVKNDFLSSDLSIFSEKGNGDSENSQLQCMVDESFIRIWYKQDTKVALVQTFFKITLKEGCGDLRNALLASLLFHLVEYELGPIINQAKEGGVVISISLQDHQLVLELHGYKEKVMFILRQVLEATKSFSPRDDQFKVIKRNMERILNNTNMDPSQHSKYLLEQVLCQSFWDVEEKLHLLEGLTFGDLEAFIPKLHSQLYIEGFCHGNLMKEDVLHISSLFTNNFPVESVPLVLSERSRKGKFMSLPTCVELIRDVRVKCEQEKNSMVELYFQIQPKPTRGVSLEKLRAVTDLTFEILNGIFVEHIRDKEKGLSCYDVQCKAHKSHCIMGISFCVLSPGCDPSDIQKRIDKFVDGYNLALKRLSNATIENNKRYLINALSNKDSAFISESNRLWSYITNERSKFDLEKKVAEDGMLEEKVAEEVKTLKRADLVNWWHTYLRNNSEMRRRLCIRVWGCNRNGEDIDSPKATDTFIKERTKKRIKKGGKSSYKIKVVKTKLTDFKKNARWIENDS